jgi:hypothetical protein
MIEPNCLVDDELFGEWLSNKPPGSAVGKKRSPDCCPIANFIIEEVELTPGRPRVMNQQVGWLKNGDVSCYGYWDLTSRQRLFIFLLDRNKAVYIGEDIPKEVALEVWEGC